METQVVRRSLAEARQLKKIKVLIEI